MKRLFVASIVALAASVLATDTASANQGFGYPFFPYGFYQPYGARYNNAIPTPPYFSVSPPVYYGSRYARPYGASPFASPPVLRGAESFRTRPADQFYRPPTPTPAPAIMCNPYVLGDNGDKSEKKPITSVTKVGEIRFNPFVQSEERLAKK